MAFLIDTNIAIHLRDNDPAIMAKVEALDIVLLSVITRVELEGGVDRVPAQAAIRRARLDAMYPALRILPFDLADADAYAGIVAHTGYSRRKVLDRMIAAQALVQRATLVTMNADDFVDVVGLKIEAW